MYDVILFPTDGSACADSALPHAIDQARVHDATLDALFVTTDEEHADDVGRSAVEEAVATAEHEGLSANSAVLDGASEDVIEGYVADRGVDLVVMGSHGRRGLDRYILGSVTESVLRSLDVPVLVVPCEEE